MFIHKLNSFSVCQNEAQYLHRLPIRRLTSGQPALLLGSTERHFKYDSHVLLAFHQMFISVFIVKNSLLVETLKTRLMFFFATILLNMNPLLNSLI